MHGTLREENFRELADQFRIHDERGHGAVAEQMMFYARRIDDFGVEIHQRFAVRKEEWSVRVDLAPDKHVLGGQGDHFVALSHVGTHRVQDAGLGHVNLGIQVRHAELTPATASGRHLHHAERSTLVGEEDSVA